MAPPPRLVAMRNAGPARPQIRPRLLPLRRRAHRRLRSRRMGKTKAGSCLRRHLHFPYMNITLGTRGVSILRSVMRKTFLLLALLALSLPVIGLAAYEHGRRHALGRGRPRQSHASGPRRRHRPARARRRSRSTTSRPTTRTSPPSSATTSRSRCVGETGIKYAGSDMRFRIIGGRYRIVIQGRGIDLSAVGQGLRHDPAATSARSRRVLARRQPTAGRTRTPASSCPRSRSGSCSAAGELRRARFAPSSLMTAGAQTILVVEDEASIASFVSLYLKNAGYAVRAVTTGSAALTQVAAEQPALIILDLMLPDIDGIEICRRVRKTSDVPILMLTARDEDVDKIIGLEVGADDYLTKPFNPRELVARVKSVLRRSAPERRRDVEEELHHGELSINAGRREVKVGDGRDPARAEGVRPALGAARPQGSRAHARPAARARLGLHVRRRHAHRRRARAAAAPQARRRVADRDRLGRRLQGRPRAGAPRRPPEPMLNSLRFRLPALFLAGIALSGLVTSLIALRLFQDFTRSETLQQLRQEAHGPRRSLRRVGGAGHSTRTRLRRRSPPRGSRTRRATACSRSSSPRPSSTISTRTRA